MTTPPDARNALAEIVAGLDGVTPGPWIIHGAMLGYKGDLFSPTAKNVKDCHHIARCFAPKPTKPVLCELQAIQIEREAIGIVEANAAHIARLDPAAIRSIADLVAALEAQVEGMRVALARSGELLEYGGFDLGFIDAALQSSETTGEK